MTSSSGFNGGHNIALGAALIIASCTTWAIWFIIQAKMSESFSSPYTSSALLCFMAATQCLVIGAGVERKLSARSLGWDIRLAASLYIVSIQHCISLQSSVLVLVISTQCLVVDLNIPGHSWLRVSSFTDVLVHREERPPVCVNVQPAAAHHRQSLDGQSLMRSSMLEVLTGSILIVVGLSLVFWGKGRELKKPSNIGGKNMEEELEEGGGSTVAISMPKYCSPGHEDQDAQPQDAGVEVSHGSLN